MKSLRIILPGIIVLVLSACSALSPAATPTPTLDREATADALEAAQAEGTQNAQATADTLNATTEAEATGAAQTEAAITPTMPPVFATLTAQVGTANQYIQSLYDGGFISTTEGSYLPEKPFDDAMAQINYFSWSYTDYSPNDFVFRSDIEWRSASDVANWFNSGCGIVFREDGQGENFYVVFLTLDGYVELSSWVNDSPRSIARNFYDTLELPDGAAEFLVTAEGEHIQVFINSKLVVDVTNSLHSDGYLAYTVVSGTNKGFGTRCKFDNTLIWEIDTQE